MTRALRVTLTKAVPETTNIDLPEWSGALRTLYWRLRATRPWQAADRRTLYRHIQKEKLRLHGLGIHYLELHLVTRFLCNPRNGEKYLERLRAFHMDAHPWK
jgi:hypothetical protein